MAKLRTLLFASTAGAALMYFFDPDRGEGRRAVARDRFASMARKGRAGIEKQARFREGQVEGLAHEVSTRGRSEPAVDDIEIKDRVESQVFGRRGFPKGRINAEVVNGRLILNGELDSQAQIEDVIAEVSSVPGVIDVQSNLHVKGTMAPNKAAARRAG
jgi:osmotically-inducible protein OsmY